MDTVLLFLLIVVVLAGLGVAFFVLRRRAPANLPDAGLETLAQRPTSDLPDPALPAAPPARRAAEATDGVGTLATLEVLDGPEAIVSGFPVGRQIVIRRKLVSIGRNPRQADIQLYAMEEPASVSRLHCTLEFQDTLRCFFITDENSSSGTRVNGSLLRPYKAEPLHSGDVIELGIPENNGARLSFTSPFNPPDRIAREGTSFKDTIRQPVKSSAQPASAPVTASDVFISYSHHDRSLMHVVREGLVAQGFSVFTDENLEPGSPSWRRDVQTALERAGCVVAILSPEAKASEWVEEELNYAKIRRVRVFTVLVRGDEANAIPFGLTGVQWIDMRSDYDPNLAEVVHQSALTQLNATLSEFLRRTEPRS